MTDRWSEHSVSIEQRLYTIEQVLRQHGERLASIETTLRSMCTSNGRNGRIAINSRDITALLLGILAGLGGGVLALAQALAQRAGP